jgi:hypothetical protein
MYSISRLAFPMETNSPDLVFVHTVELGYNVMKGSEYFVLL